jgi:hypothetical protein
MFGFKGSEGLAHLLAKAQEEEAMLQERRQRKKRKKREREKEKERGKEKDRGRGRERIGKAPRAAAPIYSLLSEPATLSHTAAVAAGGGGGDGGDGGGGDGGGGGGDSASHNTTSVSFLSHKRARPKARPKLTEAEAAAAPVGVHYRDNGRGSENTPPVCAATESIYDDDEW